MAPTGDVTIGKLLMAEYDRVKEEQKARIGFRDNLLYVAVAATVTVLFGATQAHRAELLLALPVVTCVLGWTYLANDQKISAIGRYIRTDLGPRLGSLAGEPGSPFGWEAAHRSDSRRKQRKIIQCVVDLLVFGAVPLAALLAFWLRSTGGLLSVTASILELAAVSALGAQIVVYAESSP
jgi:hypothetical protein